MQFATTSDRVKVAYEVQGAGPPLVFVHGLGDECSVWSDVVARLRSEFSCVTMDLRGHGQTGTADDYDPFGLTRDVYAVCEQLALDRPCVIGHSLGGFVATVYGARHPVRGVLNIDQPLHLTALSEAVRALAPRIHAGEVAAVVWEILERIGIGPLSEAKRMQLRRTRAQLTSEALLGIWRPLIESSPADLSDAVDRAIQGLHVPFLSLHGVPQGDAYMQWIQTRIPHALIEVWHGSGHFPHLAWPAALAARVREFAIACERQQ